MRYNIAVDNQQTKLFMEPLDLLALTHNEFVESMYARLGRGKEQASCIYSEWIRSASIPFGHNLYLNCPSLLKEICSHTLFRLPLLDRRFGGETEKFLTRLHDDHLIESVVIPMKFGKSLCVSSQVGCRMGCTFCQTGRMGLLRHLTTAEITGQLFVAKHILGYDIRNIVFMGMGEPFDNFDAVHSAIKILCDPKGFGLAKRHITVSTVGRVDGIERMRLEMDPAINLAISVNAPSDAVRKKIMPLTRKYSMGMLKEALQRYSADPRRTLLAEYVMLKGITDSLESADLLAEYLKDLPARVNLIPYNPQASDPYERPSEETISAFKARLQTHGLHVLVRITKGVDIRAACGQLGR